MTKWVLILLLISSTLFPADHYIRDGATGADDGTSWTDAWDDFPTPALTRGDTYYVADGTYSSLAGTRALDATESGTTVITIKKATASDHGAETGWDSAYGDGQAALGSYMEFDSGYWVIDGNGTHTFPSDASSDYGFKIDHDALYTILGIVRIGTSGAVSNITIKYTHVYNSYNGSVNCGTVGFRFHPTYTSTYVKIQNCFLQNSGKDGLQISRSSFILVERNYIERYGKLENDGPDYHGQTVQMFYGADDVIFRFNVWEANEGQGLVQLADLGSSGCDRVRFYGNVVFNKYGETTAASGGFNSSGGIIGQATDWNAYDHSNVYIYNNTVVNIGGTYGGHAHFPMYNGSTTYGYNNLLVNVGGTTSVTNFTDWDYAAYESGDSYGGTNSETVTTAIFDDYTNNIFTLASNTTAGIDLSAQGWWDTSDAFFGYLDSADDIVGSTRTTWSRGAYEYEAPAEAGSYILGLGS